jgi:hypothetical protein
MVRDKHQELAINIYSSGPVSRVRKILYEKGLRFLIRKSLVFGWRVIYGFLFLRFRSQRNFTFGNESYPYFYHPYNSTWDNERAVEIPIVMEKLSGIPGNKELKILEVGNVLSHYFPLKWDVLDKFEDGKGIIREDIIDFAPTEKYDLIVSISTLEHVGFDDDVKDPGKISTAINNLKQCCLKPDGKLIFSMPLGYNPTLDEMVFKNELGFDNYYFMKRISKCEWCEIPKNELGDYSYAAKYIGANAIVIATYN